MTSDKIKHINELLYEIDRVRLSIPSKTITLAEETLRLSKSIGYELGIAVSYLRIADARADLGEIEISLDLSFKALDFFINEGYYDLQWHVYNSLGVTFSVICDYDSSINYYYKAEAVINNINSNKKFILNFSAEKAKVLTLNNISENYKLLKEYDIALTYCNKAYKIDKEKDFALSQGITPLSLGEIYYKLSEYEKANSLAVCALKYLKQYNYVIAEAEAYELLALISWKMQDYKNSDKYYKLIMELLNNNQIPVYNEVNTYINYYYYLEDQGCTAQAVAALQHACTLSVSNNLHSKVCETSGLLAVFYEKTGETALAFKYYKMHYDFDIVRLNSFNKQIVKNLNIKKKIHQFQSEKNELENLNKKLLELSENDSLTGIHNRRKFDECFDEVWQNAINSHESIALLLIDIDYFKEFNDNYGHLEGDKCIVDVAKILRSFENKYYFTARYGGDEFIVLLSNSSLEEALVFCKNVQARIAALDKKHEYSKVSSRVTLSIGVSSIVPSADSSSNSLIKTTDNALYIAKKRGRNQIAYL